jgi:hypothetical protein
MSWCDNREEFELNNLALEMNKDDLTIFNIEEKVDYSIDFDDFKVPSTSKESKEVSDNINIFRERTYFDNKILDELRSEGGILYNTDNEYEKGYYRLKRERAKLLLKKTRRVDLLDPVGDLSSNASKEEVKKPGRKKNDYSVYFEAGITASEIKKLKNREAAQKSRMKKHEELEELRKKEKNLEKENLYLKNELNKLRERVGNCSNCKYLVRAAIVSGNGSGFLGVSKKILMATGLVTILCIFAGVMLTTSQTDQIQPKRLLFSTNNFSEYISNNNSHIETKKKSNKYILS